MSGSLVRGVRKRLFDAGRRARLTDGQRDYVRFVILGRGRTGSNLLRTSLSSHPNAVVHGELFNNAGRREPRIHWGGTPGYRTRDARLCRLRESAPLQFIDSAVFGPMPRGVRAVGFKLFYYHARQDDWLPAWGHLQTLGVRALHLKRRNLLAVQVSGILAARSGVWLQTTAGSARAQEPLTLDPDGTRRFFERTRALEADFAAFFSPTLDVYFEDLESDYERHMLRVLDFLELPRLSLRSPLVRQRTGRLREVLANFEELQAHFAGSEWSEFFE